MPRIDAKHRGEGQAKVFMQRALNPLLILIAVAGLVATVVDHRRQAPIAAEYRQLSAAMGTLDITDPDRFIIRRLKTEDPFDFAWRFYRPADTNLMTRVQFFSGASSSTAGGSQGEVLLRVRLRFEDLGMRVFFKHGSGSSTSGVGNAELGKFVRSHWEDLDIQVTEVGEQIELPLDETVTLLRISVPDRLLEDLDDSVRDRLKRYTSREIKVVLGTPDALAKAGGS
ncbi:hypothetical protein FYK55_23960 [Roseiconus nitratireducens]|uniref:Uncharacterized protein n=1 Tax=Roseiconus nitratireducens TaxID=2605748 RepID=A0A5M6D370_9BACT|nr:hypothetical protein [Roseiconus nitratireducens]KAA5539625.1 hypothetical protein FYK55_23960 [Roseiconus nitratireducens]